MTNIQPTLPAEDASAPQLGTVGQTSTEAKNTNSWLSQAWKVASIVAFCAGVGNVASLALATQQKDIFWSQIASDTGPGWLSFLLVAASPFLLRFAHFDFQRIGQRLEQNFKWLLVASALFFLAVMSVSNRGHSWTPDEMGAIYQAQTFASGHLTPRVAPDLVTAVLPGHLQGDIFQISRSTGLYAPTYWPGYALLMTPFALLHIEWACNVVITVLSLAMLWLLARRLTENRLSGVWAAVFALSSAQIVLGAVSYFSMPAHLLFNLIFLHFWLNNTKRDSFIAGLVGGFALILHNPVPHFSFAVPFIVWTMWKQRSHIIPLLVGYCLIFLPVGIGWSAYFQGFDPGQAIHSVGVASNSPFSEVVSRLAIVFKIPSGLLLLSRVAGLCKLIIWAAPGLAALALLGWLDSRRSEANTTKGESERVAVWLLGVALVFNFAIYLTINFNQGLGWGFRYMHQTWLLLALAGAVYITRQNQGVKKMVALWCLLGFVIITPLRVLQMRQLFDDSFANLPPVSTAPASITFIHEGESAVWIFNDPFLRNSNWKLFFQSEKQNSAIARHYLKDARRGESGPWGEIWNGSQLLNPNSP